MKPMDELFTVSRQHAQCEETARNEFFESRNVAPRTWKYGEIAETNGQIWEGTTTLG